MNYKNQQAKTTGCDYTSIARWFRWREKMSKSLGNYIGVTEAPSDMFGKVMSISDELMWDWYNLLSFRPLSEIAQLKSEVENGKNPRDVKILLAKELISRFHNEEAANAAEQEFINRFQKAQCLMKCLNLRSLAKLV